MLESFLCSFIVFFVQETKTKETCESMPKSLKMGAYSEARQKVFAIASVKFATAKYDLAAVSTKFAAAKVFRSRGPSGQPEKTHCSENWYSLQR